MGIEIGGLFGLLVLITDAWALLNVIGSDVSLLAKVIWTLVILALPVLGLLIWLAVGPKAGRRA